MNTTQDAKEMCAAVVAARKAAGLNAPQTRGAEADLVFRYHFAKDFYRTGVYENISAAADQLIRQYLPANP